MFHRFANQRRKINSIWEIIDALGQRFQSQRDVCNVFVSHFHKAYGYTQGIAAKDLLWGVDLYPTMFDANSNYDLFKVVSEGELLEVLKSFEGKKSSSLDGWTVDLFSHIFDLFKSDLLDMVEESRVMRDIHLHINSTYISLLP